MEYPEPGTACFTVFEWRRQPDWAGGVYIVAGNIRSTGGTQIVTTEISYYYAPRWVCRDASDMNVTRRWPALERAEHSPPPTVLRVSLFTSYFCNSGADLTEHEMVRACQYFRSLHHAHGHYCSPSTSASQQLAQHNVTRSVTTHPQTYDPTNIRDKQEVFRKKLRRCVPDPIIRTCLFSFKITQATKYRCCQIDYAATRSG